MNEKSTDQTTPAEDLRAAAVKLRIDAAISPHLYKELALWLEASARHAAKVSDPRNQAIIADQHALKVARIVNGGAR